MTIAAKPLTQHQYRCCNSIFMKHLRSKRLLATNMYNRSGKRVRSYYNHFLEAHYKKQGMKNIIKRFL